MGRLREKVWAGFSLLIFSTGCAGPIEGLYPPNPEGPNPSIYLLNHNDWHTGIVVRNQDVPDDLWPEKEDFKGFHFLEVSWGDRDFFQAEDPTVWMAVKAALWPTPSVLHVVGFHPPVDIFFPDSEIIEIVLTPQGFENLVRYIHLSFERDRFEKSTDLGIGLHANSRFYLGSDTFHLFKTCNGWTAKAIRSAGCPITPFYSLSARNTIYQAKKFGKIIRLK